MRKADIYLEGRLIKRITFAEVRNDEGNMAFLAGPICDSNAKLVAYVPKNYLVIIKHIDDTQTN